jgi:ribosomal protein L7/L12
MWLVLGAGFIPQARQFSRRERLGFDRALPAADQDVVTLLRQGRNIEAIKRYRDLNPGVGLREAKLVIDGLKPGVDRPGTSST